VKIAFYSLCVVLLINCTDIHQSKKASDLEYVQLKTSLVDLNQNKVNLTSFKGKKVVINYWATWCSPCIKEMPELKRAEEILQNYNYIFLLVSDETISKISAFKNEKKFDFNFLKSVNSNEINGIYSLPTTYIFDENGKKVETFVGVVTWDSQQIINKLKKI
jgi:thiol-disulfide isomerase/thioredoxin